MKKILLFGLLASIIFSGCRKYDDVRSAQPDANNFSSAIASEWIEQFRQVVKTQGLNPPQASRIYAYAGIAVYEAVVPGLKGNKSLQNQIPLLNDLPNGALFGEMNYLVAVNEAMYRIAKNVFPSLSSSNALAIESLYKKHNDILVKQVYNSIYLNSKDFGEMVSAAIISRGTKDGFAETRSMTYPVPSRSLNLGYWAPTSAVTSPLEPYWGKVKCFAMASADECEEPLVIPFNNTPGSPFYQQALEVYNTSQNLTQAQKDIALWWADGANTATPPGHWLAIANQLVIEKNISLGKAAELYALLNIGLADAFISCWDAKYKYNLLRPQTYIRDYIAGANNWSSLIGTPPFPEYPSGHSVASGTAAEILTSIFGNISFVDETNTSMGLSARSYTSFYQAADEAALSRLYGGIHYREANENGIKQGKTLGQVVIKNIRLK